MRVRIACLAAVVLIDVLLWGLVLWAAPSMSGVLDPARMTHDSGAAYSAPLTTRPPRWLTIPNDGAGISSLALVEVDGPSRTRLGPGRSPPDLVRGVGGGGFNHWGEVLFSSTDGSDPRTNGRKYEWTSRTMLHPRIGLVLLALTAAAVLWTLSGWFALVPRAAPAVFLGTVALLVVGWNLESRALSPGWINVDWDTASYLGRSPERTIGYPLMLDLVAWLSGDLRHLLVLQLNMMLVAFALLARAVDRLLGTRVVGLAIFVLLATSPRLMVFPFNVLTEAPYVAGMCVLLALLCVTAGWCVRSDQLQQESASRSRWRLAVLLGIGATLAITELVRPAAFGLAPMALLPVLWMRGERLRALVSIVAPYAVIIGAAALANAQRYGILATSSMGPVSLLGHVAWNIRPQTCPTLPELAARIEARIAPVLARRPADLPWPKAYYFWTSDEYNELLWSNAMPETQSWVEAHRPEGSTEHEAIELRRVRGVLAREAMRADLSAYAWHAGAHVYGFWQSVARPTPIGPALKGRVPRGEGSVRNLWPEVRERTFAWLGSPPPVDRDDTPLDRLTWMEWWRTPLDANPSLLWKAALAATLVGLFLAPFTRWLTPTGRLLALAGTGFQGTAVLVAAVTAVIARYVDAVEPLTVVACAAGIMAIGESIARLRPRRATTPRSSPPATEP